MDVIQLIQKAQMGDEDAFTTIYEKYYASVFIKANGICRNNDDAKDVVQETFYEVHRSLSNLRDPSHFYAWLMMITVSKCHNMFRKRKHYAPSFDEQAIEQIKEQRVYMDPHQATDNQIEQAVLHELVASLDERYAEIVQLIYFEGCRLVDVAELMQIPLGTVKTRVVRARKELKRKVLAYEKQEGRRLNFHAEMLSGTMLSSVSYGLLKKASHAVQLCGTHTSAIAIGCLTTIVVASGTAVYEYTRNESNVSIQENAQRTTVANTFPPLSYKEHPIVTNREAFYLCLDFARDEQALKQKTEKEWQEFLPIYETLKDLNSPHYQNLKQLGWTQWFENYIAQK